MRLLDSPMTYIVDDRTEVIRLRLFHHNGKFVAVISDMPKRDVDEVYDDATSLFEGVTRQFDIPLDQYSQVQHFAAVPDVDVPERFALFFPGVSVGTGEPAASRSRAEWCSLIALHLKI